LIERAGGEIVVRAEVERILVEGGRAAGVRMVDGREIRAPVVISAVGVRSTYGRLLPTESAPPELRASLARVDPSISYVTLYLGFARTGEELGLTGTNLWLYPSSDHDESFARFTADPEAPFPLVFISFPSAKDPTFCERHPGRATVDVIVPVLYRWFAAWEGTRWKRRGPDYEALKARYTRRILDVLFARLPQLRDQVDHAELSTPLSSAHFSGYSRGELYGLDHTPARYRMPIRVSTSIRGLYLTGQDTVSCGVTGALMGGVLTATAILGPGPFLSVLRR
jgi:phytoene dehydrogenase-like protein